ncbi:MAG: hypothetical protein H0W12_05800 [Chitinophagaceae bacterium]|nr:hypothetical protein [Chitinophagaceae bacterium]
MKELIEKLQNDHGLSTEQSHGILNTITEFIKEKFPMAGGMIDSLFSHENTTTQNTNTSAGDAGTTEGPATKGGSFLDKISDFIPGQMGEKTEEFAKDKLGGMFGNDNKA